MAQVRPCGHALGTQTGAQPCSRRSWISLLNGYPRPWRRPSTTATETPSVSGRRRSQRKLQLLAAYEKAIRRQLQQALEEFDQGEVRQVAFATDRHWILMLGAQEQCTLVLVMAREGLLGRARYHMEQAIQALNQEL